MILIAVQIKHPYLFVLLLLLLVLLHGTKYSSGFLRRGNSVSLCPINCSHQWGGLVWKSHRERIWLTLDQPCLQLCMRNLWKEVRDSRCCKKGDISTFNTFFLMIFSSFYIVVWVVGEGVKYEM